VRCQHRGRVVRQAAAEIRIPAGTREVEVTKDGFAAFGKKVTLSDGGTRVLVAWLVARMLAAMPQVTRSSPSKG
jgi:hypothetical protein